MPGLTERIILYQLNGEDIMNASLRTVQGGTRLVFDSVEGVTNAVEQMHANIVATPLAWLSGTQAPAKPHGLIAAGVYSAIRGINHGLREGVDGGYRVLPDRNEPTQSEAEIRAVAALNGVCGDHLEATGNTLATTMRLMTPQQALQLEPAALHASLPQASPHLVIMVHGLSLSELGWSRDGKPDIGSRLASEFDCTPLYLRYNTGRHISTNGREFNTLLDQLCAAWPVPVESISLVGHSMGGLVIRSACWYAQQEQSVWLPELQRVVCLGTPHHGSPLEKAGHLLDRLMLKTPYTAPLAFGRKRSAGIKDLRHGNLLDEDWSGHDMDSIGHDKRRTVPLLENVDYYFAAATLGKDLNDPIGHFIGDLLVRLDSAVGSHQDGLRHVDIKSENCRVFHEKNHFDLIDDARVHQQVVDWFRGEVCQAV
jgi:pimeloyl-ACP methyl ester carboxylesterase